MTDNTEDLVTWLKILPAALRATAVTGKPVDIDEVKKHCQEAAQTIEQQAERIEKLEGGLGKLAACLSDIINSTKNSPLAHVGDHRAYNVHLIGEGTVAHWETSLSAYQSLKEAKAQEPQRNELVEAAREVVNNARMANYAGPSLILFLKKIDRLTNALKEEG